MCPQVACAGGEGERGWVRCRGGDCGQSDLDCSGHLLSSEGQLDAWSSSQGLRQVQKEQAECQTRFVVVIVIINFIAPIVLAVCNACSITTCSTHPSTTDSSFVTRVSTRCLRAAGAHSTTHPSAKLLHTARAHSTSHPPLLERFRIIINNLSRHFGGGRRRGCHGHRWIIPVSGCVAAFECSCVT